MLFQKKNNLELVADDPKNIIRSIMGQYEKLSKQIDILGRRKMKSRPVRELTADDPIGGSYSRYQEIYHKLCQDSKDRNEPILISVQTPKNKKPGKA